MGLKTGGLPRFSGTPVPGLHSLVTTLGVTLDQTLNLRSHINKLCRSSYYRIRAVRHIRSSLPDDICLRLATALIHSRLDYCNSIMHGTSASNFNKLQVVQNALARTVSRSPYQSLHLTFYQPALAPSSQTNRLQNCSLTYKVFPLNNQHIFII